MGTLNFTAKQLKERLSFTRDDYERAVPAGNGYANFNDFIEKIMHSCRENNGTLEDAIIIAEDAFTKLN